MPQLAWLTVWVWPLPEVEPADADQPVVPLEELDEELLFELDEDDEELPEPVDVAEPVVAETVDVPAARAAIEPASPRNVAALSRAASIRDRFATCRRRRRGRDARGPPGHSPARVPPEPGRRPN